MYQSPAMTLRLLDLITSGLRVFQGPIGLEGVGTPGRSSAKKHTQHEIPSPRHSMGLP